MVVSPSAVLVGILMEFLAAAVMILYGITAPVPYASPAWF